MSSSKSLRASIKIIPPQSSSTQSQPGNFQKIQNPRKSSQQWNTPQSVRKYYYQSNHNSIVINNSVNQGKNNIIASKTPPSDKLTHLSSKELWYNRQGQIKRNTFKKKISRLASKIAHQLDGDKENESLSIQPNKNGPDKNAAFIAPHQQQYMQKLLNQNEKFFLPQKRSPKQQLSDLYSGCDDFVSSLFYITIPFVRKPYNYIFGVINIFLPGVGTILATLCGKNYSHIQILIGLFQLFTSIILIGWLFSIAWGFQIIMKPYTDHRKCCRQTERQIAIELSQTIVRAITIGETGERYKRDHQNQNFVNDDEFQFQSDFDQQYQIDEPNNVRSSSHNYLINSNNISCAQDHHLRLNRVHQVQEESVNASSRNLARLVKDQDQAEYQAKKRVAHFFISDGQDDAESSQILRGQNPDGIHQN